MTFRAISTLFPAILERAAEFRGLQHLLAHCATAADRKAEIIEWCMEGHISPEDAELLITAYGLETA